MQKRERSFGGVEKTSLPIGGERPVLLERTTQGEIFFPEQ